jgi:formate hydrogenlyase subunit 6/NADH:ubiquinone oxidoreductase subunit I
MIGLVLGSLFKKPATIGYPYAPFKMPDKFRGAPVFASDLCNGCRLCVRDCPSQAITIIRVGGSASAAAAGAVPAAGAAPAAAAEKKFDQIVDYGRCVYCGQCSETCPRRVITMSPTFELAQVTKGNLKVTYHASPAPAVPATPAAPAAEPEKGADQQTS